MDYKYVLIERVQPNSKRNIVYSLPDIIGDRSDIEELIDVVDYNKELKLMAFNDISDPAYEGATAQDMWDILDKTSIGVKLLKYYPNIRNFKISSTTASRKEDMYKYDVYANRKLKAKNRTRVPSFKEYMDNPSIYNPYEVSGEFFK